MNVDTVLNGRVKNRARKGPSKYVGSYEHFRLYVNKCIDYNQRRLDELRNNFLKLISEAATNATNIIDDLRECFLTSPKYRAEILTSMEDVRIDFFFTFHTPLDLKNKIQLFCSSEQWRVLVPMTLR